MAPRDVRPYKMTEIHVTSTEDSNRSGSSRLKVLWVVSSVLPEAAPLFGFKPLPFGGWLVGSASALRGSRVDLTIAHASLDHERQARVTATAAYEAIPAREFKRHLTDLIRETRPDVVHIHGTEQEHTWRAVECCRETKVPSVISIQGLLWFCAQHYAVGLPLRVRYGFTLRDVLRRTNVELGRRDFARRGLQEIEALKRADHIIGRTEWDKACVTQIDPKVSYFHCDEVMRASFYNHAWNPTNCVSHSILVSQGGYPLKGIHRVIEALALVRKNYPEAQLIVAGPDPTHQRSRLGALRVGSYGRYLRRQIATLNLGDAVSFVGVQDEAGMRRLLTRTNVFVMPSAIENSPNSLAEAMLMGVPTVSSFVGGIPSMVGRDSGVRLYQADAPYMLAHEVSSVFTNSAQAVADGRKSRDAAHVQHDPARHAARIVDIYEEVARGR